MATIRVDVSDETLAAVERERAASGETQSEFVARALNGLLERQTDAEAYCRHAETEDEVALSVALARYAFEASPWDDGDTYSSTAKRIDVSDETLAAIERERAASGETQSEFVARALNGLLERETDAEAYGRQPETAEEIAAIMSAQTFAFLESYWDDGYRQDSKS